MDHRLRRGTRLFRWSLSTANQKVSFIQWSVLAANKKVLLMLKANQIAALITCSWLTTNQIASWTEVLFYSQSKGLINPLLTTPVQLIRSCVRVCSTETKKKRAKKCMVVHKYCKIAIYAIILYATATSKIIEPTCNCRCLSRESPVTESTSDLDFSCYFLFINVILTFRPLCAYSGQ